MATTVEKPKKCKEKGCIGTVNLNNPISLQTGCASYSYAYPCDKCQRLYWLSEKGRVSGVRKRNGEKAYL